MHSILRVEHKDNHRGPYRDGHNGEVKEITNNHCFDLDLYPVPEDDIGIDRNPDPWELCGFKNVKQLREWFTNEELEILKRNDFIVRKLSLKDVKVTAVGERQLLFRYKPK